MKYDYWAIQIVFLLINPREVEMNVLVKLNKKKVYIKFFLDKLIANLKCSGSIVIFFEIDET